MQKKPYSNGVLTLVQIHQYCTETARNLLRRIGQKRLDKPADVREYDSGNIVYTHKHANLGR